MSYRVTKPQLCARPVVIDGPWRRIFPKWTGSVLALYRQGGLTPNQVTCLGFGCAVIAAVFVGLEWWWAALVLWWLGRLFDGTDGIYARDLGQATAFGGYLDILLDMASYSVMLLGFFVAMPKLGFQWLMISILYTLCITSALALGEYETKHGLGEDDHRSLRLATGLAEGGETGLFYTLLLLLPGRWQLLVGLWIVCLTATVSIRSFLAYRVMTNRDTLGRGRF